MKRFLVTPEARADLLEIWSYIADDNIRAADKVIDQIEAVFLKLSDMPGVGHFRMDILGKEYKFWSVYSYLIAYRWEAKPIEIVAIVHGARDLDDFFNDRLD